MPKRILFCVTELPPGPGGIGSHAWSLANTLQLEYRYSIDLMGPSDNATSEEVKSFDQNQKINIIRFSRVFMLTYFLRIFLIIKNIRQNNYDIFIASGKFALWMILIRFFNGASKCICILHGSEVNLNNYVLRKFTHMSIFQFDEVISVSKFTKELLPNFIIEKRNIKVIPNGAERIEIEDEGNLEIIGCPKLLTVGQVSFRKGQHRLIRALPEIIKKYPEIHYHIVGKFVDYKEIRYLVDKLNLSHYVTFHGMIKSTEKIAQFYKNCDAFVLLSENQPNGDVEGFGIVAIEANFFGLPVIGAKKTGVEEAISEGISGFLVDGNNHGEILNALQKCLHNKNALNVTSKIRANEHEWYKIAAKYNDLL